ncbi:MAG TPA: SRPBCC family protein [Candidatus Hydrogenedentes bacterium]|nr:SRPBCC family protein [Candidatus Hydrogenedentota bacterium]
MRASSFHITAAIFFCAGTAQGEIPADLRDFLNTAAISKIEAGKVVQERTGFKDAEGRTCAQGRAAVLIAKPPEAIWPHIISNDRYCEFIPHAVSAVKYMESENQVGWKETVKVAFGKISYHIIQTRDEQAHVASWRLDKSKENGIHDTHGSWTLIPHGENKTILVYASRIDSGMAVPRFIENFFLNRGLPEIVNAVKKRAESNGAYKR